MRFRIYNRKVYIGKSKSYHQASIGTKDPWAMGKILVKWKSQQKTACNLLKIHKKDAKIIQRYLQSSQYSNSIDENGKN